MNDFLFIFWSVEDQVQWVWIGIHVGSFHFRFIVFIIAAVCFNKYFLLKLILDSVFLFVFPFF